MCAIMVEGIMGSLQEKIIKIGPVIHEIKVYGRWMITHI